MQTPHVQMISSDLSFGGDENFFLRRKKRDFVHEDKNQICNRDAVPIDCMLPETT
jgi:hypothetical protein